MKTIINCPFNAISAKPTSHRGSQGMMYYDMIKRQGIDITFNAGGKITEYNDYDAFYVYHGNDYNVDQKTVNLFGGLQQYPYVDNVVAWSQFLGKVYSIGIKFPPYHKMLEEKFAGAQKSNKPIDPRWKNVNLENIKRIYETAEVIKYPGLTDKIVVGDSHAICMYRPGWTVNSIPFKTLNGIINLGLETTLTDFPNISELEFYFGNIDIRHHLCRLEGSHIENAKQLAARYVKAVEALPYDVLRIYEPLPIEDESRKLPKTGWHKGQPFHGTWQQRNECREVMRDEIDRLTTRAELVKWTDYLLNSSGQLDFKYMEKPGNIHLARSFYPHWTGIEKQEETTHTLNSFFA